MTHIVSIRRESGDPAREAFTDQSYALLEELKAEFRRDTGKPFEGGGGVLLASDVLLELQGHGAAWSKFDVAAFEGWIRENAPDLELALSGIMAELMCFTSYLARTGRLDPERALATEERAFDLLTRAGVDTRPRNRRERRAARGRRRRTH